MSDKVILPGSYDPITVGHLEIIREAARLFDEVYVVAFINPDKQYLFTPEERLSMLCAATEGMDSVICDFSSGLVVDYMKERGITKIIKGYRNDLDLEYEKKQAEWNKFHGGVDTDLIKCKDEYSEVSSTAVRRALSDGRIPYEILPNGVGELIRKKTT